MSTEQQSSPAQGQETVEQSILERAIGATAQTPVDTPKNC